MDVARFRKLKMSIDTDRTHYEGRRLKIRGRELCDLPPELFLLTELEILDLSPERQSCLGFSIGRLPASICKLENLRVLALDTNELTTLPSELTKLAHLERLALSNNQLSRLPEQFEKLQNLKSLHLANNSFHEFPIALTFIEGLEFLDFCDNNLTKLPDDIEKLTNLKSLLLFINKLVILPDSICTLINMHTLWLGCNHLLRLPRNFGKLRCLDWGRNLHTVSSAIDGNAKLKRPPIDICKRGVDAIEQFFVQLDNIENKT